MQAVNDWKAYLVSLLRRADDGNRWTTPEDITGPPGTGAKGDTKREDDTAEGAAS